MGEKEEHPMNLDQPVKWLECEISGYRKGYVKARFDVNQRVLVWSDSNHWFQNFVKTVEPRRMDALLEAVHHLMENELPPSELKEAQLQGDLNQWRLSCGFAGEKEEALWERVGYDLDGDNWQRVQHAVEEAGEHAFEL